MFNNLLLISKIRRYIITLYVIDDLWLIDNWLFILQVIVINDFELYYFGTIKLKPVPWFDYQKADYGNKVCFNPVALKAQDLY